MIARKLIDLIEKNSGPLAHGLLHHFRSSEKMADLRKVPAQELEGRAFEVYRNLSDWLLDRTERTSTGATPRWGAGGRARASP